MNIYIRKLIYTYIYPHAEKLGEPTTPRFLLYVFLYNIHAYIRIYIHIYIYYTYI